ncbi:putative transcription regulator mTERF family [Lupinus albus]|uniref:Putative transcription regulator mTERF family n=1 Tax=Lupinus albus TaxID=3870 RepID=A0A6A4QN99_LUPAL|nr:putative transcription regulator mTERF family [Lupinus albus]
MISQLSHNVIFLFHLPIHKKSVFPPNPVSVSVKVSTFIGYNTTHLHFPVFSALNSTHSCPSPKRLSHIVKTEGQRVLMDYLYLTRGYNYLDAEYISKNSPRFIHGLVSKINVHDDDDDDVDVDVARELRKFLRFNPINEFEPFFESLGVNPSELHLFLPSGIMFLDDDHVLLDSFHTLSSYGIPRNRIGKIYKEAKEIFGYAGELLLSKFQAYEDLGLSRSTVIKLVVCCPSLLVGDINSEFVAVLDQLKKIGIGNDWIVNYMSCSRTYSWKRMIDNMQFLREVGYSEKHMHDLFMENPKFLLEGVGKVVYTFLDRSIELGLEMSVIYSYFTEYPHILSNKYAKNLLEVVDFLCFIGMGKDDIVHILSNYMHLLSTRSFKGPSTVCKELKVEKADLCQIIKDDPLKLISVASKLEKKSSGKISGHDPRIYLQKVNFLQKLGYAENTEEMAKALKRFRGRGDQLQERFDCLVAAGLDYNSVVEMVKRAPMILNQKKDVIEKKIDFLRNVLGCPVECVVGFPSYFCHNLEKNIERFSMYAWLKERNAVNPAFALSNIVSANDKRFVKYFVDVHPEGPTIWKET